MVKSVFFTTFAVVCAVIAIFVTNNQLWCRHWFVLVTFGQFPGLKTYGPSCDNAPFMPFEKSTRFSKHKHCFNETGGIYWYDANRNLTMTKQILLKAVEDHCPVLIARPFHDDKCFQRLEEFAAKNPDFNVRQKDNVDELMDGLTLFPK